MKRICILVMITCMLTITPAYSQIFQAGVKGGVSLSKISFSGSKSNLRADNRTGFFIGPTAEVKIPLVGIGLEISALYAQDKLECDYASADLNILKVPVNFKWSAGIRKIVSVYVAAGPQFDFNLGHTWESDYLIEKRKISCNVGTGIKLINHIQLGVNYNFSFNRMATLYISDEWGEEHSVRIKNNGWQVSLTFLL